MSSRRQLNLDQVRAAVERRWTELLDEIEQYPSPIAGCDEQFNHLLLKRQRIGRVRARLRVRSERADGDVAP